MLRRVWEELSYRLDVVRAAGVTTLSTCKTSMQVQHKGPSFSFLTYCETILAYFFFLNHSV